MSPQPRDEERPPDREDPWERFARAFVHEARSPLNALGIYLELLAPREGGPPPSAAAQPARLVERAQDQVRRVGELLAFFSDLWSPKSDRPADLASLGRAAGRLATHEAVRHNLVWESRVPDGLVVPLLAKPSALAHGLLLLLDGALAAPEETELRLTIRREAPQLVLEFGTPALAPLLTPGIAALTALGATADLSAAALSVTFPA